GLAPENRPISEIVADPLGRLALRLARDVVPGFRTVESSCDLPRKPGRPRRWPPAALVALWVNRIKDQRNRGVVDAIRVLQKRDPKTFGEYSARTLQSRYYEGRKEIVGMKVYLLDEQGTEIEVPFP